MTKSMTYVVHISALIACAALFGWATIASAHVTGLSFEKEIDGYLVDIGYGPEQMTVGAQGRFDFAILDPETGEPVPFTDVWVRIMKGNRALFAGGIAKARLGGTSIVYSLPEQGAYEVSARFQNGSDEIVETSFPINVQPGDSSPFSLASALYGLLGIAVGIAGGMFIMRQRKQ